MKHVEEGLDKEKSLWDFRTLWETLPLKSEIKMSYLYVYLQLAETWRRVL